MTSTVDNTISDIRDVDKLPRGTVLRDYDEYIWQSQHVSYLWYAPGDRTAYYSDDISLPATILYKPNN